MIRSLICLTALACVATGCAGSTKSQHSRANDAGRTARSASPTTQPILYHRTGGIAGTNDHLVIWPDGFVQIDGELFTPAVTRLADERHAKIRKMFDGWERLQPEYLANNIADAYLITIHYGDKSVTASDIAPDLPQAFRDIFTELEAVAFEAQQQQNVVKPPPATP